MTNSKTIFCLIIDLFFFFAFSAVTVHMNSLILIPFIVAVLYVLYLDAKKFYGGI